MGGMFGGGKTPKPVPEAPRINQEVIDRQNTDTMGRRKGSAANVLTTPSATGTSGSVAAKTLLGN